MDFKICAFVVLACASLACATTVTPISSPETTTTPKPVTTSSTAAPTTSSAAPPTTSTVPPVTSTPAPVPSDGRGNWTVHDGNVTCIIAQMALSAKIVYPLENSNKTQDATLTIPPSAKHNGTCGPDSQNLDLTWGDDDSLKMVFGKNSTTKSYFVSLVSLTVLVSEKMFPNVSSSWLNATKTFESKSLQFQTALNQSYRCGRDEMIPLKLGSEMNSAVLTVSKVQLQAFHDKDSAVFGEVHDCEADTPDIVPIAVGCALAALVIVVLVAYLVGRRRSLARGYLSM